MLEQMNMNFAGRVFMESPAGIALASLGQIVEGYVVVFGAQNRINLRMLGKKGQSDFLIFLKSVRARVEQHFGPTVMFEHGAASAATNVSCGVDRMHVHIVPYIGRSLKRELEKKYKCGATVLTIEQMLEELSNWESDSPYFWIEEHLQTVLFSYGEKRESQVVRRVIAEQVGMIERWNWREYPTDEVAQRVAKKLSANLNCDSLSRLHATCA